MGCTACTEPQCLYKSVLYLYLTCFEHGCSSSGRYLYIQLWLCSVCISISSLYRTHFCTYKTAYPDACKTSCMYNRLPEDVPLVSKHVEDKLKCHFTKGAFCCFILCNVYNTLSCLQHSSNLSVLYFITIYMEKSHTSEANSCLENKFQVFYVIHIFRLLSEATARR